MFHVIFYEIEALFLQMNQNVITDCHLLIGFVGQIVTETI